MNKAMSHLRANAIAYLALFVALGGTSYAAISLPRNSVGNRQIRNHSIDPDKLNPRFIRGNVRIWARVSASGRVLAGGRGVKVIPQGEIPGDYFLSPGRNSVAIPRRCAPIASVDDTSAVPGYADAEVVVVSHTQRPRWQVVVNTYSSAGVATSLPFDVALIC